MWGMILISQLILLPMLIILGWVYIRFRPQGRGGAGVVRFDAVVLGIALLASVAGVLWVGDTDIGNAIRIWKPILSIITTFHIFPLVLCIGWWLRRRRFAGTGAAGERT
jgi:ABC-type molybdate transport system permease subunit